ncbi:hypothetical protein [Ochrobactrum sp. MYb379]|uniref:hypothetical protein n=1 Tax=Ochrobactrum sp. MYb379 TaxID=2745275 RepID=UPI00309F23E0
MAMKLKYPARISFRLTASDEASLESLATSRGIPRASLARKLVMKGLESATYYPSGRTHPNVDELRSINASLGRLTSLANQLAAKANSGERVDANSIRNLQSDVAQMRLELRMALNVNRADP